jgi:hypothetical protein
VIAAAAFVALVAIFVGAIFVAAVLVLGFQAMRRDDYPEVTALDNARDVTGRTER